ncbi:MAG TPA: polyphenol oxidase family protein [Acidimicrobiales bacterium]|nr:polyphenol oxidase family protein [Acidimicrobiales bacterium]
MTTAVTAVADWQLAGDTRVVCTGWPQGDMAGANGVTDRRRRAVVDLPWTVLRQVHGARVVTVDEPGGQYGEPADAAVSGIAGAALAVLTADCAPVALASPEGLFGVAHAGWKGLRAGVVEATVQSLRRMGATRVEAVIGPCIHPCCYSFGEDDLSGLESRLGRHVRATDRDGRPALDLPAGVRAALHSAGAVLVGEAPACTGCTDGLWSWRTARTERRQATVAWRP